MSNIEATTNWKALAERLSAVASTLQAMVAGDAANAANHGCNAVAAQLNGSACLPLAAPSGIGE